MKTICSKLLAVAFCFTLLTGYIVAQDSALKEKFQKMNNEMIKSILAEDMDAIMAMYTDDCISMPSYSPTLKGKAAMIESHKKQHEAGFKMNSMTLTTTDVFSSGDYAYEIGTYTVSMSMPGMEGWKDNGKYMTVWQKQSDNSWKVKAETWNTDNNPWADMEMAGEDAEDDMDEE